MRLFEFISQLKSFDIPFDSFSNIVIEYNNNGDLLYPIMEYGVGFMGTSPLGGVGSKREMLESILKANAVPSLIFRIVDKLDSPIKVTLKQLFYIIYKTIGLDDNKHLFAGYGDSIDTIEVHDFDYVFYDENDNKLTIFLNPNKLGTQEINL